MTYDIFLGFIRVNKSKSTSSHGCHTYFIDIVSVTPCIVMLPLAGANGSTGPAGATGATGCTGGRPTLLHLL